MKEPLLETLYVLVHDESPECKAIVTVLSMYADGNIDLLRELYTRALGEQAYVVDEVDRPNPPRDGTEWVCIAKPPVKPQRNERTWVGYQGNL